MRVSSPVGDYPYVVRRVALRRGRVVIEGSLGVWDTTMEIEPRDWLDAARRIALPAAVAAAAVVALKSR